MTSVKGKLALMGSGELTSTMVEVHKDLLAGLGPSPRAVFLDTPAGFELNVDQISRRVVEYFRQRVLHDLTVASFKSCETTSAYDAGKAFRTLEDAGYILIGPGSPTYALRHWKETPVPDIFVQKIEQGGCLTAASAAALTVGRLTIPVYEIYKVGDDPSWAEGMDILGRLGFPLIVVPHWNNAEGGTFDTRFCFMGEPRFQRLEALMPDDVGILGIDEHTACILDFQKDEARVRGIGTVTLRRHGTETVFKKGDRFPLQALRESKADGPIESPPAEETSPAESGQDSETESMWDRIHELQRAFNKALEQREPKETTSSLLELDRLVWKAQEDLESAESISQAREVLRDLIVLFGMTLESSPQDRRECLAPLVEELLGLRTRLRDARKWEEADAVRDALDKAGIVVEDTPSGSRWHLVEPKNQKSPL